tara:strand:+ start:1335 stop:1967 length:633 start_codon:yes stop_codon:yes gene_type:complete
MPCITTHQAEHYWDLNLHMAILFTILVLLYFLVISKVTKKAVNKNIDPLVENGITPLLSNIDNFSKQNNVPISWDALKTKAEQMQKESKGLDSEVKENHNKLLIRSILIASAIWLTVLLSGLYFRYYLSKNGQHSLPFGKVILQNIAIFICVLGIEGWFFLNVAQNWIPASPAVMSEVGLNQIKEELLDVIINEPSPSPSPVPSPAPSLS